MPFSVRTRIAIVFGAITGGLMLVFAVILQAVNASRVIRETEDSTRDLAIRLGERIVTATLQDTLPTVLDTGYTTIVVSGTTARLRTTWLTGLLEGVPHYVYVLARNGRTLLASHDVREMDVTQRVTLDSVVGAVSPGQVIRVRTDATGQREAGADPFFSRATVVPLQNGRLVVYSVSLVFARPAPAGRAVETNPPPPSPQTIDRVVVAEIAPSGRLSVADILGPLLILGPLVAVAVMAAAHYATTSAYRPIGQLIGDAAAVTDGRSLHRRLAIDENADDQLIRLTDTLNAMIARLETSFGTLRRFTADASHELKTPLTVLRADVERASSRATSAAERAEALEEAIAEIARMANLVESLLTLARADEGRFDLHREPVDMLELVKDVHETATLLGEPRNVQVQLHADEPVTVMGDRARLRQLCLNLVENGIKYTPDGGDVELSLTRVNGTAQFSVHDTGIGIAAADLPHIFDRFWRADRARSRGGERTGFGLGLAISQYIAQAHGGSLSAQSRLGRGSTFVLELPLAASGGDESDL